MTRFTEKQYQWRVLVAMAIYSGFMLIAWPLVRATESLPLKVLLALAPVVPVFYVIAQLVRRIRASDELEQRTHLVALSVATGVVSALSLAGGFLSIAGVLTLDGSILIWVFPVMAFCYGLARWRVLRGYGGDMTCDEEAAIPLYVRFLSAGAIVLVIAWWCRAALDDMRLGFLWGMGAGFTALGIALGVARWRKRRDRNG
ncbi:hypothetical protein GCM10007862_32410 [Dyella lipolytica]|uniref:Transmembrane protein n=1 Tax=Dyella lipolytica TaxID=1867835 RepID=A0ABW8IWQ5_9GAMM|nr:hypothetical protein [Dyella lipolytica]GLQ48190.1 hypothetical protein GCM10007862_32410 [Dyella lipolytica]